MINRKMPKKNRIVRELEEKWKDLNVQLDKISLRIAEELLLHRTGDLDEEIFRDYLVYAYNGSFYSVNFEGDILLINADRDFDESLVLNFYEDNYDVDVRDRCASASSTWYSYDLTRLPAEESVEADD